MKQFLVCFTLVLSSFNFTYGAIETGNLEGVVEKAVKRSAEECLNNKCPKEPKEELQLVCGFDAISTTYKMFPSKCALSSYAECYKIGYIETPLEFCIKAHTKGVSLRRMYGESCPVFCPAHWSPVCGARKSKSYAYRSFNNGCYLDMINCRAEDEDLGYVEVPLEYCQKHMFKNMFKEKIYVGGNVKDYRDYE